MRKKTGSFLKRIATGGVLAAGIALLFAAGCDLALDPEEQDDEEALVEGIDEATGATDLEAGSDPMPTHAGAGDEGDATVICHFGPLMTQEDSEDLLVTESELPAHLAHGDVFGSCADFFCGAS